MGIQHQLALAFDIVEDCHFSTADDGQLLLLEWVQPADKDVRLHSAGKLARGERGINVLTKITATMRRQPRGFFAEQKQDGGDIMRSKTPQDVLLRAQFSQVQP